MNEEKKEKFGYYYRCLLLIWVLIVNLAIHLSGLENGWLLFLSNIMMFAMEGSSLREKYIQVEVGGFVGLLITIAAIPAVVALEKSLGSVLGFLIPIGLAIAALIMLHPFAPRIFNSAGFLYFTVASLEAEDFLGDIPRYLIVFVIGSLLMNGVALFLEKPAMALTERKFAGK